MCADVAGLIAALGEDKAILIGHDWGATIVWNTALFHADKVRAVAGLSVPHTGRGPMPRIELFRELYKGRFFYQLYFQEPGAAETELEADVRSSLRKIYYWGSGEAIGSGLKVNKPGRVPDRAARGLYRRQPRTRATNCRFRSDRNHAQPGI
jgi:pimeloyl-ACP methyl ester carboxylesterase